MTYRRTDDVDQEFTVADLLGCVGADLIDAARRVEDFPPALQAAASSLELAGMTSSQDALSMGLLHGIRMFRASGLQWSMGSGLGQGAPLACVSRRWALVRRGIGGIRVETAR